MQNLGQNPASSAHGGEGVGGYPDAARSGRSQPPEGTVHDQQKQDAGEKQNTAPVELNAPPVQFQMAPSLQSAELMGLTDPVESEPAAAQSNNLSRANAAVQTKGGQPGGQNVHQLAQKGVGGAGGALPHLGQIQSAFGQHDVSGVKSHVGGAAADANQGLGAEAYATGNDVAFKSQPDLHTAAHEAAHVVQQRGGVQLKDGVGQSGDAYERHADTVADAVVAGESAEPILDQMSGRSAGPEIQFYAGNQDVAVAPELGGDGDKTVAEAQTENHGAVERDVNKNPALKARFEGDLAAALLIDSAFYKPVVTNVSKKIYEYIETKARLSEGEADTLINADLDQLSGLYGGVENPDGSKAEAWERDLYFGRLTDTKKQLSQGTNDPYHAIKNVLQGGGGTIPNQMFAHHQFMDHIYGKDMQHHADLVSSILSSMHQRASADVQQQALEMKPKQMRTQVDDVGGANPFGMKEDGDEYLVDEEKNAYAEDKNSGRRDTSDTTHKRHARGRFKTREAPAAAAAGHDLHKSQTAKAKMNDKTGARSNSVTGIHGGHLTDPGTNATDANAGQKLGEEHGGGQRHSRGVEIYTLDESQMFIQEARVKYDMPLAAGISGTTTDLMECAVLMGIADPVDRFKYALGCLAQLMGAGAHSFHEVMSAAKAAGVPYSPGDYRSIYGNLAPHNARVKYIFDEKAEYRGVKGIDPTVK